MPKQKHSAVQLRTKHKKVCPVDNANALPGFLLLNSICVKKFLIIPVFLIIFSQYSFSQDFLPADQNTLDSIREANIGNVLVFNMWAYWCAPCKEEFPELVKLYNNYKDKGVKLIFVSLDFPETFETQTIPFLKEQGVDFTTYYNNFEKDEQLINYMDINWEGGLPGTFMYNKDGKLSVTMVGARTYDVFEESVQKLLD